MRSMLICHDDDELDRHGLPRWLASFSDLRGIVALREPPGRRFRRARRELARSGPVGFLDVLAFRAYHRAFLAAQDRRWEQGAMKALAARYPDVPAGTPVASFPSPNTPECERFLRAGAPDVVIARCKVLLAERIFSIPRHGTFVMHPGICPEYRNSHGCFWALAQGERALVGMTLLRVDRGVDTGPVFGHYTAEFDERHDSHLVIQGRVTFDNLDAVAARLEEIVRGQAKPIDVSGRRSGTWGQPRLTAYWRYARRTAGAA